MVQEHVPEPVDITSLRREAVPADTVAEVPDRFLDRELSWLRFNRRVLELAEDAIYHALYRSAPDLDREVGDPLAHAATDALTALALRLDHWRAVVDVRMFDVEVGVVRALEILGSRL